MAAVELSLSSLFVDANLQAYWPFNETSGTAVADDSANTNTGTASNADILNNAGGQFNNYGLFTAASSRVVTLTDAASLKPTGNFTIIGWIDTATVNGLIFQSYSLNPSNVAGIQFKVDGTGKIVLVSGKNTGTGGSDFTSATGATTTTDGNWHMVAGRYNGSALDVFVDSGTPDGTVAWANGAVYAATNYVRIGCDNSSGTDGTFFNGGIDDLALFDRALSNTEISNRFSGADALATGGGAPFMTY